MWGGAQAVGMSKRERKRENGVLKKEGWRREDEMSACFYTNPQRKGRIERGNAHRNARTRT